MQNAVFERGGCCLKELDEAALLTPAVAASLLMAGQEADIRCDTL